jgi:hypothetical protein
LAAKQVRAKGSTRNWLTPIESSEGNSHSAVPYLCFGIDACIYLKPRVPFPSHRMIRKIEINIKVDPLPLRRKFKLLVSPNVAKVGADKQFSNIPIPESIGLFRHIRRGLQIEILVRAYE